MELERKTLRNEYLEKINEKMQPNSSSTTSSSSSIYINPKFRVHINPNFLSKSTGISHHHHHAPTVEPTFVTAPTQIYVNPRFFANTNGITQSTVMHSTPSPICHTRAIESDVSQQNIHMTMAYDYNDTAPLAVEPLADTKIHTRTKICNNRAIATTTAAISNLPKIAPHVNKVDPTKFLIKIGSKKLLRVPAKASTSPFAKSSKSISKLRRPLQTKYKIVKEQTAFKIDRRSAKAKLAAITVNVVPTILSRKLWINESLTPTRTITR